VSADGGVPQVIVAARGNETLSNPQVLPGGQAVLFSAAKSATWDTAQVQVQSLDGGARKTLVENASDGRYLPTGHLVYAVQGVLLVAPFDLGSLSVTGAPVPLVQGVTRSLSTIGGAQYTSSQTGVLAFEPGPVATASSAGAQDLVIVDRQGKTQPVGLPPGAYDSPRVSPDGRFVAFDASDTNGRQVWIAALGGGTAMRQLTFTGHNQDPIWSPDGKWVAFQSDRDGDHAIFRKRADGSAVAERLTKPESSAEHVPQAFSPDGLHLLYSLVRDGHWTLWAMNMKDKTATAFGAVSSAALVEAAFSPDGKWVAYQSNGESGTSEEQTFLQPFPATGAKYLVGDGGNPYWSPKGDQLILNWGPTKSEIVPVSTTPTVALGQPIDFPRAGLAGGNPANSRRNVDSLPDGEHIIGVTPSGQATTVNASSITVVLNWFDEVRQRVR
jgi:roadblock/LC7 domain-containing protein